MNTKCAIDIGTTNIEAALVDSDSGNIMSTIMQPNINRNSGRDVMTRITQAERGNLDRMSTELRAQLSDMICVLMGSASAQVDINQAANSDHNSHSDKAMVDITQIVIACNTTMTHILLGENCHNLGIFPFSPVHTQLTELMSTDVDLLPDHTPVSVTILPGFSAFVGGDIMAGVISLDILNRPGSSLLIDLGTNGEMVYHDPKKNKLLITSTAAGPAFELAGRAKATEIIEGIALLRQKDIIDETGLLIDEYFESGYRYKGVNITQSLIRDVQTAKSAIRSGIDILLRKASGSEETVIPDNIFIAGAFGDNLDIDAAISIGMFPKCFRDRCILCGNTSLSGAIRYSSGDHLTDLPAFEEIYLSMDEDFNSLYIDYMGL